MKAAPPRAVQLRDKPLDVWALPMVGQGRRIFHVAKIEVEQPHSA